MSRFYLISAIPKTSGSMEEIEAEIDKFAHAWFRFARGQWIVRDDDPLDSSGAELWTDLLSETVRPGGQVFVVRLNMSDRQGWMTKRFWRWVDETGG